jgi:hypothetical protein
MVMIKSTNRTATLLYCLPIYLVLIFVERSAAFAPTSSVTVPSSTMTSSTQVKALAQYAPQAISLFNNMMTPAAIIGGAIVPLGFMAPLSLKAEKGEKESRFRKTLRILYSIAAVASFTSQLLAVVWATVTINKLIETSVAPAESVW